MRYTDIMRLSGGETLIGVAGLIGTGIAGIGDSGYGSYRAAV